MRGVGERIDDCQSAVDEPLLHVFGQQHGATRLASRSQNKSIPKLELVFDHKIDSRRHRLWERRGRKERLRVLANDIARLRRSGTGALEDHE